MISTSANGSVAVPDRAAGTGTGAARVACRAHGQRLDMASHGRFWPWRKTQRVAYDAADTFVDKGSNMILEIADFTVRPGTQDDFGAAMERGVQTIISKAAGYLRHEIQHGIETPERFVLMIEWATLENHTVDFRGSAAFTAWREIVGPYFAKPPHVEHFHRLSGTRSAS